MESYSRMNSINYAFLNWTVTIHEPLEVNRFPFDRQILKCSFFSDNCKMVGWDPEIPPPPLCPERLLTCQCGAFYGYTNWTLHGLKAAFVSESENGPWRLNTSILAARSPDFYLINIVGLLFLIVMFAASVYVIPYDNFSERASVNMTLLLTAVAFKFVTVGWVPQVSYLTLLDWYTIIAILMLMVQVLENFIVAIFSDMDNIGEIDEMFAISYVVVWVGFHLLIVVGAKFMWFCASWDKVFAGDDSHGTSAKCEIITKDG